jgi:hypothetical protein
MTYCPPAPATGYEPSKASASSADEVGDVVAITPMEPPLKLLKLHPGGLSFDTLSAVDASIPVDVTVPN